MAADRSDRRAAILAINYSMVFWSEVVYHIGPRGGFAGDDHRLSDLSWRGSSSRTNASQSSRSQRSAIGIVGVAVIFIDQLRVQNLMAFLGSVGGS